MPWLIDSTGSAGTVGEYFKPLRRKLGVVTLSAACALAMFWARGFFIRDDFGFPVGDRTLCLSSGRGEFRFEAARRIDGEDVLLVLPRWAAKPVWLSTPVEVAFGIDDVLLNSEPWKWSDECSILGMQATWFRVPCWSIVIPLTLLSMWLLLSKPRTELAIGKTAP